jgi:hypothetical protein
MNRDEQLEKLEKFLEDLEKKILKGENMSANAITPVLQTRLQLIGLKAENEILKEQLQNIMARLAGYEKTHGETPPTTPPMEVGGEKKSGLVVARPGSVQAERQMRGQKP